VIAVAVITLALGAAIGYSTSSEKTTTTTLLLTQTSISTITGNRTVTLIQTTTLPPNEVITKVVNFVEYILFPVVTSTNCGVQSGGGSLGITTITEISYVATTTASLGTTVTVYNHETTNSVYEITDNNLASTYASVIGNSTTVTTTVCETLS